MSGQAQGATVLRGRGAIAFLTGATGFIGSRVARQLARQGYRLRCLVRESSDTTDLERAGAEILRGDLLDRSLLAKGLDGAALAIHMAGAYDIGVVDSAVLERTNVEGTRAFIAAVEEAGTPRAVYISTTAALGPVPEGTGDETTEHPGDRYRSVYERTKVEAHRLAVAAQRRGVPLVIVCPANVYGPGDRGPNARFLMDLLRGRVPALPRRPAWWSYVHVDDVAAGILLAAEYGRTGTTYVLSGEDLPLDEFARRAAALAGRRPPRLRLPTAVLRLGASLMDALARVFRFRSSINRESVDMADGWRWLHSHTRATRELGWMPRPLEEGLPETIAWLLEQAGQGAHRNS